MNSDEEDLLVHLHPHHHHRSSSPPPSLIQVVQSPSPHHLPRISMSLLHNFRKPNPKVLSFFLQALIMITIITVFFLFMGFAAIFLLHICIVGRTLHRVRNRPIPPIPHFTYPVPEDFDFGSTAFSSLDLQKLPFFNYKTVVQSGSSRDCVVCLDGFREEERFRILPKCKHAFHANCIDAWLMKASACPICRGVVELDT